MKASLGIIAVIAAITGCTATTPTKVTISAPYDGMQTRRQLEKGNNTIKGSALIRQRGGGVVTCAGQEVRLVAGTNYASERIRAIYGSDEGGYNPAFGGRQVSFVDAPAEYFSIQPTTRCDAQGYFKFENLADGFYYVASQVVWKVRDYVTEGGILAQRVSLKGGETKEIVLAPR